MRILFATWDGGGTVPAEMGVIRQLLAAGHEVTVIGDITLETSVLHAGRTSVRGYGPRSGSPPTSRATCSRTGRWSTTRSSCSTECWTGW